MNPTKRDFLDHQAAMQAHDLELSGEFRSRPELEDSSRERLENLQNVLRAFAQRPKPMLPDIAEAALSLCHADSAGVSIETIDALGSPAFQWAATSGKYARFRGFLLPTCLSPCRISLDTMRPQHIRVSREPFAAAGIAAEEITDGVSMPWSVDETRGTVWIVAHERPAAFNLTDYQIMRSMADLARTAIRSKRDLPPLPDPVRAEAVSSPGNEITLEVPVLTPSLPDKPYLFTLKAPHQTVQLFMASTFEIHDDQLALLNGRGGLVALIVLDIIEGWCEVTEQSRLADGPAIGNAGQANTC